MADNEKPLFQGMDEFERTFAPGELPPDDPERVRANLDEGSGPVGGDTGYEPPAAAPVASVGSSPSGEMAPPNTGHEDRGGGPGDPDTQARDPFGADVDDRDGA
ncbi:MAG: hypothetical protein ABI670_22170 [Chloroflexota bacterium]